MLTHAPTDPAARVGLARVLLATPGHEAEAAPLLSSGEFGDFAEEAKRLNTIIELRAVPHSDADLATAQSRPVPKANSRWRRCWPHAASTPRRSIRFWPRLKTTGNSAAPPSAN